MLDRSAYQLLQPTGSAGRLIYPANIWVDRSAYQLLQPTGSAGRLIYPANIWVDTPTCDVLRVRFRITLTPGALNVKAVYLVNCTMASQRPTLRIFSFFSTSLGW